MPATRITERHVEVGGHTLRVREAGDPGGRPLVYFHGTPSCRLEPAFADRPAAELGVRLVSFDRPGYGESPPVRFSLGSVARDTAVVADALGIDRFATHGQSDGGPFSGAGSTSSSNSTGSDASDIFGFVTFTIECRITRSPIR